MRICIYMGELFMRQAAFKKKEDKKRKKKKKEKEKTSLTEVRHQMRSGELSEYLSLTLNCLSISIVLCS